MTFIKGYGRAPALVAVSAALVAMSACGGERSAEADTPVSEAEVSTELPESVVSDEQLQATANAAAELAATPPAQVLPVTVPSEGATAANNQMGAGNAATNTTGR